MKSLIKTQSMTRSLLVLAAVLTFAVVAYAPSASALPAATANRAPLAAVTFGDSVNLGDPVGGYPCGGKPNPVVMTSIKIGCRGQGNPILDATFAIIRILSIGVGFAVVAGLIIAGIQLTASRGDPQLRAKAIGRLYNVVIALFVYIFAYAILNYVIPAGFFK